MARRRGETKKEKAKKKQKEKKHEHLTYKKRLRLEVMLRQKIHKQTIADELRVHIISPPYTGKSSAGSMNTLTAITRRRYGIAPIKPRPNIKRGSPQREHPLKSGIILK